MRTGVAALIVAAGRGLRAGAGGPKQYRRVAGRPMLAWSAETFSRHPRVDGVQTVIGAGDGEAFVQAVAGLDLYPPVEGGATRQESVLRGLEALSALSPEIVLIHDAARPFLPAEVIDRCIEAIEAGADGACAGLPIVDTLRAEADGLCGPLTSRDGLWRAQTPQAFRFEAILEAHRRLADGAFTDDAELAREAGLRVALVPGDEAAMKITRPEDFAFAERWARSGMREETRVGQGFDVHAFGENADGSRDHVMLCGVRVPHENGLLGHSDADVGLHAATDAILGAASLGDIGRHFPPSDPAWRGAASDRFLADAVRMLREAGGRLTHLDVTLICERPKIGPHATAMRERIAAICGVAAGRVSVKATTSERLGFTGRGEGIAAMATATVAMTAPEEDER